MNVELELEIMDKNIDEIHITDADLLDEMLAGDGNDGDGYLMPYSPNDARQAYLETPTFEQQEEEMYRYVLETPLIVYICTLTIHFFGPFNNLTEIFMSTGNIFFHSFWYT